MRRRGCVFRRKKRGRWLSVWWFKYSHRGKTYRETSRSSDRRVAERLLRRRLDEIGADRLGARRFVGPAAELFTVAQALDGYDSAYCAARGIEPDEIPPGMQSRNRVLRSHWGNVRAVDIDGERIERYRKARRAHLKPDGEPLSFTSINRELQHLRAALNIAAEDLPIRVPVIRLTDESGNVRRGFFETPEFEAVVKNLIPSFQDFARFAFWTGMRKGGVAALLWRLVVRTARTLLLLPEDDKAGDGVLLKLPPYLWQIIERRWADRIVETPTGPQMVELIFHHDGHPIQYKSFDRQWKAALTEAGIVAGRHGRVFHDLRRTAVRNMRRAGVAQDVIMKIAGMKTDAIFRRYNIVDDRDVEEALARTVRFVRAQEGRTKIRPLRRQSR